MSVFEAYPKNWKLDSQHIVIFEGPDGAGKTTVRDEFHKQTDYKYLTLDRFSPSKWVYGMMRGQDKEELDKVFDWEDALLAAGLKVTLVYFDCDTYILLDRAKIMDEEEKKKFIAKTAHSKEFYTEYLKKTKFKYFGVDTSRDSPENIASKIVGNLNGSKA